MFSWPRQLVSTCTLFNFLSNLSFLISMPRLSWRPRSRHQSTQPAALYMPVPCMHHQTQPWYHLAIRHLRPLWFLATIILQQNIYLHPSHCIFLCTQRHLWHQGHVPWTHPCIIIMAKGWPPLQHYSCRNRPQQRRHERNRHRSSQAFPFVSPQRHWVPMCLSWLVLSCWGWSRQRHWYVGCRARSGSAQEADFADHPYWHSYTVHSFDWCVWSQPCQYSAHVQCFFICISHLLCQQICRSS